MEEELLKKEIYSLKSKYLKILFENEFTKLAYHRNNKNKKNFITNTKTVFLNIYLDEYNISTSKNSIDIYSDSMIINFEEIIIRKKNKVYSLKINKDNKCVMYNNCEHFEYSFKFDFDNYKPLEQKFIEINFSDITKVLNLKDVILNLYFDRNNYISIDYNKEIYVLIEKYINHHKQNTNMN